MPSKVLRGWHFLSLDAPTIAVLWTFFASTCFKVPVTSTVLLALFVAVWILYSSDRLLDVARPQSREILGERHFFHQRYRKILLILILGASGILGYLVAHLPSEMMHLYLYLAAPVAIYFLLVHAGLREFPKEFVVGFVFAIATFIPLIHESGVQNLELSYAFLFGVVCSINCLFIKAWEEGTTPLFAIVSAIFVFMATLKSFPVPAFFQAIFLSVAGLVTLHLVRRRVEQPNLRIYADLALLTPLLILLRMRL